MVCHRMFMRCQIACLTSSSARVQARLKAALTASGIDQNLGFRGLSILRVGPTPSGAATEKLLKELEARGGRLIAPSPSELAMLFALTQLLHSSEEPARFEQWLAEERPVSSMACFRGAAQALFGNLTGSHAAAARGARPAAGIDGVRLRCPR